MLTIRLCCADLDGDVHALIDEQIKLKFFSRYTPRARLKCKFRKIHSIRKKQKKNSERKTKTLEWIIYDAKWWLKNWLKLATTFALSTIKLILLNSKRHSFNPTSFPLITSEFSFRQDANTMINYHILLASKLKRSRIADEKSLDLWLWLDALLSKSSNVTNQKKKIVFRIFLLFKHYKITALSKNEMQVFTKWQHTQRKI